MAKHSKSKKSSNLKQYAPIGLWVSGLFILIGGLGLVVKLIAFMGFPAPIPAAALTWLLWISLAMVIIGPAVFALIDPDRVREFLTGRQARYGSNAIILLIAFIGILVVVNIITFQNPVQGDWTEDKSHTLAPETLSTLKALPAPVHAIAFFTTNTSSTTAQQLLSDIKAKSNGKFTYEMVDPNSNPVLAQQYKIAVDGTIVLTLGSEKQLVTTVTEEQMTNAMVRLMNPTQRTVYFLTGHGEHDTQSSSQTTNQALYSQAATMLESKNYTVKTLNLRAENKVPTDAKVIIIAGPTQSIPTDEVTLLSDFMAHGGALIVLEEPSILMETPTAPDPLVDYLTSTWGITLNNDLVIDPNQNPPYLVVGDSANYASHPITNSLTGKTVFFPTARSLTLVTASNVQTTNLIMTVARAWGETDFTALKNNSVVFDSKTDLAGPLPVAVAAVNSSSNGRLVVIGDSDFASDTYFGQYGNSDLMINSVDWAAGQENIISLTAKQPIARNLKLPSTAVFVAMAISLVCILPGLILGGGILSWLIRRSRG
jgi:ABC-type uncharacterized transport system involved in gliding motility auxiliary subunit